MVAENKCLSVLERKRINRKKKKKKKLRLTKKGKIALGVVDIDGCGMLVCAKPF